MKKQRKKLKKLTNKVADLGINSGIDPSDAKLEAMKSLVRKIRKLEKEGYNE